jgi:hypothetical protein
LIPAWLYESIDFAFRRTILGAQGKQRKCI